MANLIVHAVLEDLSPRALVERDGEYYCVAHPDCALSPTGKLTDTRFRAALSKHDYEPLTPPLVVADVAALKRFLASRAIDPVRLIDATRPR